MSARASVLPGRHFRARCLVSPALAIALAVGSALVNVQPVEAQLSDPCSIECGLVLGATSFVFASGVATAVGRSTGGFSTTSSGIISWTSGFVVALGGGIALAGNGDRQRRAIYSAGIGTLTGAIVGLAADSFSGDSSHASRVAATLVGAAAGALTFGIYGAATWDEDDPTDTYPIPVALFSIPIGF